MEGTIQKTKIGYVVYVLNRMNMRGYHGKGDQGFPQKELSACTPFRCIGQAKSYRTLHLKDDAEILEVTYDTTYTYKTVNK